MKTSIFIIQFYDQALQQCRWQLADQQGQIQAEARCESWQDVPSEYLELPCYIIVPGHKINVLTLCLPTAKLAKNQQALAYAAEEQLLNDIEQQQLMVLNKVTDNTVYAAVIERAVINNWLATLATRFNNIQTITPDIFCLPWQEHHWTIAVARSIALIRINQYQAYSIDKQNLLFFLDSLLAEVSTKPTAVDLYTDDKTISLPFTANHFEALTLANLLSILQQNAIVNFAPTRRKIPRRKIHIDKRIRNIGLVFCSWLAAMTGLNSYELAQLQHANDSLQQQIQHAYFRIFPHAKRVVSPEQSVTAELQHLLANQKNTQQLFSLLNSLGAALQPIAGKLQSIHYQAGQLQVSIALTQQQLLPSLLAKLAQDKVQITQQRVVTSAEKIEVQLWLKQPS